MDERDLLDILATVRDFVRDEVVPAEEAIEEHDAIPDEIGRQAAAMGLFGFTIPTRYGGLGLDEVEEARLVMELGYTTPAFRSMFGTNNGIAGHVLLEGATDAQRTEFLPKLASGEWTASFALTEPEAGSDPSTLTTTARQDGSDWVISGSKRYITNAPSADVFMVFARTDPDASATKGISTFLVERDRPGLTVGPKDRKMGQAGALTADVHFEDVRVPGAMLVGDTPGLGYATALRCLAHGRIHIAALCVGLMQRLMDESVAWAASRHQSGRAIGEYQLVQGMLADSQTDLMAARALVLETARAYRSGEDRRTGPSCAKYFASEAVCRVADRAVQIHGGAGYIRGVPVERLYRDARLFRLYEGTSQIQQLIIARQLLRAAQG
ncbi:MAG TPA: acyl-CoA dehydrogenase family protein [Pseudonocardiaceae bacterium]